MSRARSARRRRLAIMCGWTSTAMTRPSGPTSLDEFEGEATYSGARLQDSHSGMHERLKQPRGVLREFAHGARQNVPGPPRTDAVFGHA